MARRVALIGAGPASLTVARDLAPLGYEVDLFDDLKKGGGFMLSQIPGVSVALRTVLDEEVNYILDMGIKTHLITMSKALNGCSIRITTLFFVGTGAPRGRELKIPGRDEGDANIHMASTGSAASRSNIRTRSARP
jgi:NADPH-dependent glutamate synthase beta subunit-like oxidoreductase